MKLTCASVPGPHLSQVSTSAFFQFSGRCARPVRVRQPEIEASGRLERVDPVLHALHLYSAVAVSGAAAGSGARRALTSAEEAVMCRAKSSGTVAVGISASGSSVIAALDGVTLSSP